MAFTDTFQLANGWIWGTSTFSAAQTDTELVVAPGAGSQIEIAAWKLAADAAIDMTLDDEDQNIIDRVYLPVDGDSRFILNNDLLASVGGIKLVDNKALDITTVGAGNTFVGVLYRVVTR